MTDPRLMAAVAAFAISIAVAGPARAEQVDAYWSGDKLFESCDDQKASFVEGLVMGYTTGVIDGLQNGREICVPNNVNVKQLVDMSCQFIRVHPEKRHLSATSVLRVYFKEAFSCRG